MNVIILSIIVLGIIGIVGAAVLFVVARRFHVQEDPRIDEVEGSAARSKLRRMRT